MSMSATERSLDELEARAAAVFSMYPEPREKYIEIARTKSPTAAFNLALITARYSSLLPAEAMAVAKATRWLAIIKRDYGQKAFERIVEKKR